MSTAPKFTITAGRKKLVAALRNLSRAGEPKAHLPILRCVDIAVEDGDVRMTTTDLDHWLTLSRVHLEVDGGGRMLINVKELVGIVESLGVTGKDDDVSLCGFIDEEGGPGYLQIRSGGARQNLTSLEPQDYPCMRVVGKCLAVATMHVGNLRAAWKVVSYAIGEQESRYQLAHALLEAEEDGWLRLTTTDGHRLASVGFPGRLDRAEKPKPREFDVTLLAGDFIEHALRNYADETELRIEFRDNDIVANVDGVRLITRRHEGNFPDYRRVVARDCNDHAEVPSKPLIAACASIVKTARGARSTHFAARVDIKNATITAPNGGAVCELSLAHVRCGGEGFVGANAQFIAEAVAACGTDSVLLRMKNENSQIRFEPIVTEDPDAYVLQRPQHHVLMPVNLAK